MRMYIKSIDERAWIAIQDGWTPPRTVHENPNDVVQIKPERLWTNEEQVVANFNSRALNAIFTTVDVASFMLISSCVEAREAWLILQEQCEGSENI